MRPLAGDAADPGLPRLLHRRPADPAPGPQGNQPARLLHYNCLPVVMAVVPNPDFFFNNPSMQPDRDIFEDESLFSEAKQTTEGGRRSAYWVGNFFPDLKAWDKVHSQGDR